MWMWIAIVLQILQWIEDSQRREALGRCLITPPDPSVETFETDGKRYDRKKYLEWRIEILSKTYTKRQLNKRLEERKEIGKLASEETLVEIDAITEILARY